MCTCSTQHALGGVRPSDVCAQPTCPALCPVGSQVSSSGAEAEAEAAQLQRQFEQLQRRIDAAMQVGCWERCWARCRAGQGGDKRQGWVCTHPMPGPGVQQQRGCRRCFQHAACPVQTLDSAKPRNSMPATPCTPCWLSAVSILVRDVFAMLPWPLTMLLPCPCSSCRR